MRKTTAALIAALPLAGLAGCGGDSGGLRDALDSVSQGPAPQRFFAWSDTGTIRDQAGDLPSGDFSDDALRRWQTPLSVGVPSLAQRGPGYQESVGFDVYDIDAAMTVGELSSAEYAIRLDGAAGSGYLSQAVRQGAREAPLGERTVLVFAADDDGPARLAPNIRFALVDEEDVAVATDKRTMTDVLGDGETALGDDEDYAAAADCLGDVVSATISPAAGVLVATGTRGGDSPADVLCAIGSDQATGRAASALREALEPERGDRFTEVEVDDGTSGDVHYARAVGTPGETYPLGYLTQAMTQGLVTKWLAG